MGTDENGLHYYDFKIVLSAYSYSEGGSVTTGSLSSPSEEISTAVADIIEFRNADGEVIHPSGYTFLSDMSMVSDSSLPGPDPDGDGDGDGVLNRDEDVDGDGDWSDDDTDNDGIIDLIDGDDDGDGLLTSHEKAGDTDNDGTPDYLDTDDDGDGILTAEEGTGDSDSDGTADYLDPDSDGDGVADLDEGSGDTDSDGTPDYLDTDDDGDGILTAVEGTGDSDSDGTADYLDLDSDEDGVADVFEGSGDTDSDGTPDYLDTDDDGDGILTAVEGTGDSDSDGLADYLDPDSGDDGADSPGGGGGELPDYTVSLPGGEVVVEGADLAGLRVAIESLEGGPASESAWSLYTLGGTGLQEVTQEGDLPPDDDAPLYVLEDSSDDLLFEVSAPDSAQEVPVVVRVDGTDGVAELRAAIETAYPDSLFLPSRWELFVQDAGNQGSPPASLAAYAGALADRGELSAPGLGRVEILAATANTLTVILDSSLGGSLPSSVSVTASAAMTVAELRTALEAALGDGTSLPQGATLWLGPQELSTDQLPLGLAGFSPEAQVSVLPGGTDPTAKLTVVESDGAGLLKDAQGVFYIDPDPADPDATPIVIRNANGSPVYGLSSSSGGGRSGGTESGEDTFSREPVAVEEWTGQEADFPADSWFPTELDFLAGSTASQSAPFYVLAVRESYGDETEWELYFIEPDGTLDWESKELGSIASVESLFGNTADLDGDGATGLDTSALEPILPPAPATLYVGAGDTSSAPFYEFYRDADGTEPLEVSAVEFLPGETYTFERLAGETGHPFYVGDTEDANNGYWQSISSFAITGDGSSTAGITGGQSLSFTLPADYSEGNGTRLSYYCTVHSSMVGALPMDALGTTDPNLLVGDTAGFAPFRDGAGNLWVAQAADGSGAVLLTEADGAPAELEWSWSEGSEGSGSAVVAAVRARTDDSSQQLLGYEVLVQVTSIYEGRSSQFWELHQANANGVLDRQSTEYLESVASLESRFDGLDLNGDGATGRGTLAEVDTFDLGNGDTLTLEEDGDGFLYVIEPDDTELPVARADGSPVRLQFNEDNPSAPYREEVVAIAPGTAADTYLLATKITQNEPERGGGYDDELGGDYGEGRGGGIGDDYGEEYDEFPDDSGGAKATRSQSLPSSDPSPTKTGGGDDGASGTAENVSWIVHVVKAESGYAVPQWDQQGWSQSIANREDTFDQDLDGDGAIGIDTAGLTATGSDSSGDTLLAAGGGELFIQQADGGSVLPVTDRSGNSVRFNYSDSWERGSFSTEAYAVEADDNGNFLLAVKSTQTFTDGNGEEKTEVNWEVHTISADGVLDYSLSSYGSITPYETIFKADLNGDGTTGIDPSGWSYVATDDPTDPSSAGHGSNAYLKTDADGAVYLFAANAVEAQDYLRLVDPAGGSPRLNWSSEWDEGSSVSTVVAVEQQGDGSYLLAVRYDNSFDGETRTEWQFFTAQPDSTNGIATLSWDTAAWSSSARNFEDDLGQDLDGDGAIGLANIADSLTPVDTDDPSVDLDPSDDYNNEEALYEADADGGLYILEADGSTYTPITDGRGAPVTFSLESTGDDYAFSEQAYAVEKQDDGSYRLAVRTQYDDKEGDRVETSVSWALYKLSPSGQIDWDESEFAPSIATKENLFEQDLNGDGAIGQPIVELADLEPSEDDDSSTNARLYKDDSDNAYLVEGASGSETITPVTDRNDNPRRFDSRGSWEGPDGREKFRSEAVAVERLDDQSYRLVVRHEYEPANGPEEVNWEIFTLDATGQLTGPTVWSGSIGMYEPDFGQDLDGDGAVGASVASLMDVASDAEADAGGANPSSTFLKKDEDGLLTIVPEAGADPADYLRVAMTSGGFPVFDHEDSYGNRSYESEAVAVEEQPDGTFLLAVRFEEKLGGVVERTSWEVFTLDSEGTLDWSTAEYTEDIASYEPDFGQDLDNADNDDDLTTGIGRAATSLTAVFTGPSGAVLLREDNTGDLFLDPDGTGTGTAPFPIVSDRGTPLRFDYEDTENGQVVFAEEAVAVRTVSGDASQPYRLLVKLSANPGTGDESVDWVTYSVDADGQLDFSTSVFSRTILAEEADYGQDLNGDSNIGASWTAVRAGESGETLEKAADGALRIVDGSTTVTVRDPAGAAVVFDYEETWTGGGYTSGAYAVERQDNGTPGDPSDDDYLLAIRSVQTSTDLQGTTTTETYWETYRVSLAGTIDWQSGTWSSSIAGREESFGEDLNGRNGIGIAQVTRTNVQSDTVGERLQRDDDNALYIDDPAAGSTVVAIVDADGGVPVFDFSESGSDWTYTSEAIAVERQDNGTAGDASDDHYLLAVRVTETGSDGSTTTFWETFRITLAGVLQWDQSTWNSSIQPREARFGQDLDGDGNQGIVENLTEIDSDNVGDRLLRNAAGQLFLREVGENDETAITDSVGFQPVLGESETRTDGSTLTVEPFAVEGFTVNGTDRYKLLLREQVRDGAGTVLSTAYHAYTLSADAVLQWDSFSRTESSLPWEAVFNQDFNGVNGVEDFKVAANLETVSTDQTGAGLAIDPDSRVLYIEDGGDKLRLVDSSGGTPTFREKETYTNGSYEQRAFAVESQDNGTPGDASDDFYLLAVRETDTYTPGGAQSPTTEVLWKIFTVSGDGVLSWDGIEYRTNADVDETVFNQDLNGNGTIAAGRSGSAAELAGRVNEGTQEGEVLEKFGNRAQSDFFAVTTKDGGTVTFFSDGDGNSASSRNEVTISAVQNATAGLQEKMAGDAGYEDDLAAQTDVLNFTVELTDPKKHGKIHKMTFALPEGSTDVTYFKLNEKTGEYYEFSYDPSTGEGARIESSDPTADLADVLAVYIRDNGQHDEDSRLGYIRDPGTLSETGATAWSTNNGVTDLTVDSDSDGTVNLLEYFADSDPHTPQALPLTAGVVDDAGTDYLSLQVTTNRATEPSDLTLTLEGSSDLSTWTTVPHTHSVTDNGDGTYTHTYRQDSPVGDQSYLPFLRLQVSKATN